MKQCPLYALSILIVFLLLCTGCNPGQEDTSETTNSAAEIQDSVPAYGGFESQIAWGKHIVIIGGCNDCHTPKKMGANGVEDNMDLELSGNPSQIPPPDVNRKEAERKFLMVAGGTFTSFVGPWGVSYAANITSDSITGIGSMTVDQFKNVFKLGKYKGAPNGRYLLPPMPWKNIAQMTNDELEAVFAYLQSTKPIHNIVPQPEPPTLMSGK